MSKFAVRYEPRDSGYGYVTIIETGRCTPDEAEGIRNQVIERWKWCVIPNTKGAIFKVLDGSSIMVETIAPPTLAPETYDCVKISAEVGPFAPEQTDGPYDGQFIASYRIVWQEIEDTAVSA